MRWYLQFKKESIPTEDQRTDVVLLTIENSKNRVDHFVYFDTSGLFQP